MVINYKISKRSTSRHERASGKVMQMDKAHLNELISVEQTYWWHIAKRELFLELLKRECPPPACILEGGMGSGNNLLVLKQYGYKVSGLDQMQESVDRCRSFGITEVQVQDLQQSWTIENGKYDLVVLLDVIEHCQNPVQVLHHAKQALRPGGKIIITVPAIPFLIGPWDRALGHHRRYTIDLLKKNAAGANLRLTWHSHWNSFSLLPAFMIRIIEKYCNTSSSNIEFLRLPNFINEILIQLAKVERKIIQKTPIPFGLSLIGVMTYE